MLVPPNTIGIVRWCIIRNYGAQTDLEVGKGSVSDAATTRASASIDVGRTGNVNEGLIGRPVRDADAIATKARWPAVENGRCCLILSVLEPVPVWEISAVVALVTQGLLVLPNKHSVPGQEDTRAMGKVGLVDVTVGKVIGSGDRAWSKALVDL